MFADVIAPQAGAVSTIDCVPKVVWLAPFCIVLDGTTTVVVLAPSPVNVVVKETVLVPKVSPPKPIESILPNPCTLNSCDVGKLLPSSSSP